jgi:O-antigen/teichoic acid export membrane protein
MTRLEKFKSIVLSARPHLLHGSWASVEALVAPVVLFALSPWLLHRLGANGFGQWALALTVAGFAHVASLGAGVSTMYAVADFNAKGEKDRVVDAIKAGFSLALMTSVVLMAFAWLVSYPIAKTLFVKMGDPPIVVAVLLLGVCSLALQELDAVFAGALRGLRRYDLVALLDLFGRPIWALSIAAVAYTTSDVISILIAHNIYYLVRLVVRARIASFILQKKCFGFPDSFKSIKNIANFGKWISLQSIGGVLFSTMDKVFVGWLFGSGELARYSICLQIVQFSHSLQAAGLQIITPWVAQKKMNWRSSVTKYNFFKFCLWAGLGSLILPFLLVSGSWLLLKLWMGVVFANNNADLLMVLLAGTAILAFTIPAHYVLLGLGKAKFSAVLLVFAGIVSLLSATSLAAFGLMGFAIGRMMYGAIACLYLVPIWRINYEDSKL